MQCTGVCGFHALPSTGKSVQTTRLWMSKAHSSSWKSEKARRTAKFLFEDTIRTWANPKLTHGRLLSCVSEMHSEKLAKKLLQLVYLFQLEAWQATSAASSRLYQNTGQAHPSRTSHLALHTDERCDYRANRQPTLSPFRQWVYLRVQQVPRVTQFTISTFARVTCDYIRKHSHKTDHMLAWSADGT